MRRVRAIAIIAVLWGVLWFVVGMPIRALTEAILHADFEPPPPFLELPLQLMAWGVVGGALFAVFLLAAERRRTLHSLSWVRVVIWGALGSLGFPIVIIIRERLWFASGDWVPMLVVCTITAILGAASAGGTLALAKRGATNSPNSGARAA